MLKSLLKNVGIVSTLSRASDDDDAAPQPSVTLSLDQWNCDQFPWADFSEVTSAPSTSRNTGKAPADDDESEEYDPDDEDGDEGDEDDEDDASLE